VVQASAAGVWSRVSSSSWPGAQPCSTCSWRITAIARRPCGPARRGSSGRGSAPPSACAPRSPRRCARAGANQSLRQLRMACVHLLHLRAMRISSRQLAPVRLVIALRMLVDQRFRLLGRVGRQRCQGVEFPAAIFAASSPPLAAATASVASPPQQKSKLVTAQHAARRESAGRSLPACSRSGIGAGVVASIVSWAGAPFRDGSGSGSLRGPGPLSLSWDQAKMESPLSTVPCPKTLWNRGLRYHRRAPEATDRVPDRRLPQSARHHWDDRAADRGERRRSICSSRCRCRRSPWTPPTRGGRVHRAIH